MSRIRLLLFVGLGGCTSVAPCAEGTLFLELTFGDRALGGDRLRVDITVAGNSAQSVVSYGGRSSGDFQVDFPHGYPSGAQASVMVTAVQGTTEVARGSASGILQQTCTRFQVSLSGLDGGVAADGSVDLDMETDAGADMAAPDAASDMATIDMVTPDMTTVGDICMQTGAATACASMGYLFCDGFEGSFPGTWATDVTANAQVTLAGSPVCRGTRSFRSSSNGPAPQRALIFRTMSLPNPTYVRFFVNVPVLTSAMYDAAFLAIAGSGFSTYLRFHPSAGALYVNRDFATPDSASFQALPTGRWVCLEVAITFATSGGRITVTSDESLRLDQNNIATLPPGGGTPNLLTLGMVNTRDVGASDMFFDEMVVSSSPIGCR